MKAWIYEICNNHETDEKYIKFKKAYSIRFRDTSIDLTKGDYKVRNSKCFWAINVRNLKNAVQFSSFN